MYSKPGDGRAVLKRSATSPEMTVPLVEFAFISTAAYWPADDSLLLTGVREGRRTPNLKDNFKGDIRLYRWRLPSGPWDELYGKYAHDPAPIPGSSEVAFHCGNGLAIVDADGVLVAQHKVGRFRWGPPSLSASPAGTKIAMIKWKGEDQKLFVYDRNTGGGTLYKQSCLRYCWYDENHILYFLHGPLRLLDVQTGKSTVLLGDVTRLPPGRLDPRLEKVRELKRPGVEVVHDYDEIAVSPDRIYFALGIWADVQPRYSFHGVCCTDREAKQLEVLYVCERELVEGIVVDEDGTVALELGRRSDRQEVVERRRVVIGSEDSPLRHGWHVMPTGRVPEFGFHYLGR